jgi:hypothetical protein
MTSAACAGLSGRNAPCLKQPSVRRCVVGDRALRGEQ